MGRLHLDCVVINKITDDPVEGPGGLYWCTYLLKPAATSRSQDETHTGPGVSTFAVHAGTDAYADATGQATR